MTWSVTEDVLRGTVSCTTESGSTYDVHHDGVASEHYLGVVCVDRATFAQRAEAECSFVLRWGEVSVRVSSSMTVTVSEQGYEVEIEATAYEGETQVSHRSWQETVLR